jgi:hypothetical protein
MKKILLSLVFLFIGYSIHSQVLITLLLGDKLNSDKIEFGLDGGLTLSTLQGLDHSNNKTGFNLGFYFDFKLKNPAMFLNTGVMVKGPMGAEGLPVYSLNNSVLDSAFMGGSVARKLNYFYVPVLLKYKFKNNIYIKAGIQLGLKNSANDKFVNSVNEEDDLVYKNNIKKNYHPLDGGLSFGVGYRLMKAQGMNLGITYYLGLIDARVDDSTPNQFNRAFYFNVGIPIGKKPLTESLP